MEVSIKGVRDTFRNCISEHSKWVIIEDDFHYGPVKILIGTTYRTFNHANGLSDMGVRTPQKSLHEAHIVITTDFVLREFNVIKNRYGSDGYRGMTSDHFLNFHLDVVIKSMGYSNPYEIELIKHAIVSAICMVTDETITLVGGKFKTMRDLHLEKNLIKYRTLKHNFVNARVS
jgi:hypothetical protein